MRPARWRLAPVLLAQLALLGAPTAAPAAATAVPRASLTNIERQVMCVTCKIPLNVAESPQADRERAYIQGLIDEGRDEAQIKDALVGQYGSTVLGLPATHGFDLTVYLVPAAVVVALLGLMVLVLRRWRRAAHAPAPQPPGSSSLSASDSARLDADLSRFD